MFRKILTICILSLVFLSSISSDPYGIYILGLYKSSEGQKERENEIFYHLSNILSDMGISVRYWDVDKGLPDSRVMEDCRGIISWFRGSSMLNPREYLEFLNRSIDDGKKVIVLDNLGAYQDRNSGQYIDSNIINITLSKLGILYLGDWTDNPDLIQIASKDSNMVEWKTPQDLRESRFYYRFQIVDRFLKAYLTLERKDTNRSPSPVIMTNRNGGFALSRYIYSIQDGQAKMMLNLPEFLQEALFPRAIEERIALLVDPKDDSTDQTFIYTQGVLKRAKLPYDVITAEQFSSLLPGDLRSYTAVGLVLKKDSSLDPKVLESYLEYGGGIVSLVGGNFNKVAQILGMGDPLQSQGETFGHRFRYGFVLGEGISLDDREFSWLPGLRKPAQGSDLIATNFGGDIPLLWQKKIGNGTVLVWNWDAFGTGYFQGLILESFLRVRPIGVAATPGIAIMSIDDWPLPMYNIIRAPYDMIDTDFYREVWWPEIKQLFNTYDISYTPFIVFNYNANTAPPFTGGEFYAAEEETSLQMAFDIFDSGIELGLHGYNHVSLTMERTSVNPQPWPSRESMKKALSAGRQEWISLFGESRLPFAYVAPNNIISLDGEIALSEVFPSIRVISALRAGGEEETITEFGPHPTMPWIYYIPRNTWGYPFTSQLQTLIVSAISGPGIWSHFIHADDVYDTNRSKGMNWEELKGEFHKMIQFTERHYPWIEYVTLREAYYSLKKFDESGFSTRWENNELIIESEPGTKIRLRINEGRIVKKIGIETVYSYKKMPALVMETTETVAHIRLSQ